MNCSQIARKFSAYMDNELDAATSHLTKEHLEGCPDCREFLRGFMGVDNLVHALPKIHPSADFTSRVVSAAIRTSDVSPRAAIPFDSRLKRAVTLASEVVFSLFEPSGGPNSRALDEFNDCPPLSLSFIYLSLLGEAK
jgi:predicted anti-sigma-YlaC factor YlaD